MGPPVDALPNYYCMHVVTVSEASVPLVLKYEFHGLPADVKQMLRLFDSDYSVNISNGVAKDVVAGKTAVVHRIGCDGSTMLPLPSVRELVKGGKCNKCFDLGR